MVHTNVTELPTVKPVTVEVGEPGLVIVAVPVSTVHKPVPTTGVFAFKFVVVTLHKA